MDTPLKGNASGAIPNALKFLIITLLVLAIFFRFLNLDRMVYWGDETYTSLRVAGYTTPELVQELFQGEIIEVEDLQKYQIINGEKSVVDTLKGLALEEPQLSPLYFVFLRFWRQWFGNSVVVTRSFSAVLSLFAFTCLYWLCRELFSTPLVGWIAIALLATSPLHLLYAKDARPYSLWTVTILLSSWLFLRAVRLKTPRSWIIYAATIALSLYSFIFSAFVVLGHGIYLFFRNEMRWSKSLTAYLLAFLAGILAFLPWLGFVANIYFSQPGTNSEAIPSFYFNPIALFVNFAGNLSRVFFDFNLTAEASSFTEVIPQTLLTLVVAALAIYALYSLCRETSKEVWVFIITLIATTGIALILISLIWERSLSNIPIRYQIPCALGVQLAVAYLFAKKISAIAWKTGLAILLSGGVLSCLLILPAQTWWHTHHSYANPAIAKIINQSSNPVLIVEAGIAAAQGKYDPPLSNVLSLSYLLAPKVKLELVVQPNLPTIPEGFSDIFLFTPSRPLRAAIKADPQYELKSLYRTRKTFRGSNTYLWKLEKKES